MNFFSFALAFAAQALPPPDGPAWEALDEDDAARYALDPASIRRDGAIARFNGRAIGHTPNREGMRTAIVRYRLDCARRTIAIEAADAYREDGSLLVSHEALSEEGPSYPIDDYSTYRLMHARACAAPE